MKIVGAELGNIVCNKKDTLRGKSVAITVLNLINKLEMTPDPF